MEIPTEQAIKLAESGWWKGRPASEITRFQLFTEQLCMDFGDFHAAVEEALGRPVWSHEFASPEHLRREFLGEAPAPSFKEIMDMIPAEKRLLLVVDLERGA